MRRSSSSPRPRAVVSRRTTLGLAAGGVGAMSLSLAGCTPDDLDHDLGGGPQPADESPDVALVAGLVAAIDERLAAVTTARASTAELRAPLRALQEMHEAHRAVLDPPTTSSASPSTPSPTSATPAGPPARVLRRLRAAEAGHQTALVEAAVAARSGALARLVGSMSASVAQHLAALPAEVAR